MSASESPVFHDPEGRRWRRVRRIWLALSVLVTALAIIFIASVLANPVLPSFNLKPNRSATVAALPRLIHEPKARGFKFVAVSELAGVSRDQAMPVIPPNQRVFSSADAVPFFFLSTGGWILQWVFLIGILLGVARLLFIGSLAR